LSSHRLKIIGVFTITLALILTLGSCDPATDVEPTMYELTIETEGRGEVLDEDGEELVAEEGESDTLEAEENTSITLEAEPADGWEFDEWTGDVEAEEKEISVPMDENKAVTAHFNEKEAYFEVEIDEEASDSEILQGKELTVIADISNTGNIEDTQDIILDFGDEEKVKNKEITVAGEDSEKVTFTYEVPGDATAETKDVTVSSNETEDSYQVEVLEPANYLLSFDEATDDEVEQGDSFTAVINVENTGDVDGEKQAVEFYWNQENDEGEAYKKEEIKLEANESDYVTFTLEVAEDAEGGETDYHVAVRDDSLTSQATVLESAYFAVDIIEEESNLNVGYGQKFQIAVNISNEGDVSATQMIEVIVDGKVRAEKEVTVDGTDSKQITLEFDAEVEDDGKTLEVRSEDDDSSNDMEVFTDKIEKRDEFKADYNKEFDLVFIEEGSLYVKFINEAEVLALPEKVDVGEGNYVERYADEIKLEEKGSFIEGNDFGLVVDFSEENLQDMRGEDAGEPITFALLDDKGGEILVEFTVEVETD